MVVETGAIVEGTVVKITPYGAFVELPDGRSGLVHIREIADVYVKDVRDYLKEQEKVKAIAKKRAKGKANAKGNDLPADAIPGGIDGSKNGFSSCVFPSVHNQVLDDKLMRSRQFDAREVDKLLG